MSEEMVVLAWKSPYNENEAFLKILSQTAENLLKYNGDHYRRATEEEYAQFAAMVEQEKPVIQCHKGEAFVGINGLTRWEKRGGSTRHCSYCGSVHPDDLQKALEQGTIRLGGSDWKYGFPHKFYVYPQGKPGSFDGKFYTKHLLDMDSESFNQLAPLLTKHSGIEWGRDEKGETFYRAPYQGYQR